MAVVGPIALTVIVGIMDLGIAIWSYNNIAEAAREGARYAQVHGAKYASWRAATAALPVGTAQASGPAANDPNVEAVVRSYALVSQPQLTVVSSWANGNNNPNSPVTVEATYSYSPVLFLRMKALTFHTQTTAYINY